MSNDIKYPYASKVDLGKLKETDFGVNSLHFPVQQKYKEQQISIINDSGSRNYWH